LINPAKDFAELWAESNGVSRDILLANDKFRQVISEAVDEANMQLSPIERIRRFILVNEAFTIENGLLTPTMKIRRRFITDLYREQLESLYPR
jgi:long-chain acyl-CoA synthetase